VSERLLCYAKWTVVNFVIDQLIWIYILQWLLKQQCACTCSHVAPLPVSEPTRFCIHYLKILYVLSREAANTNFSHWLHPDAERTRALLHSSRPLSTTSLGWSSISMPYAFNAEEEFEYTKGVSRFLNLFVLCKLETYLFYSLMNLHVCNWSLL
jgi:hypothetical protein